jgi:hypothetical protein
MCPFKKDHQRILYAFVAYNQQYRHSQRCGNEHYEFKAARLPEDRLLFLNYREPSRDIYLSLCNFFVAELSIYPMWCFWMWDYRHFELMIFCEKLHQRKRKNCYNKLQAQHDRFFKILITVQVFSSIEYCTIVGKLHSPITQKTSSLWRIGTFRRTFRSVEAETGIYPDSVSTPESMLRIQVVRCPFP